MSELPYLTSNDYETAVRISAASMERFERGRRPFVFYVWRYSLFSLALLGVISLAAATGDLSGDRQPASTVAMNARLNDIWLQSNPIENFYLSEEAVKPSRAIVAQMPSILQRIQFLQGPERFLLNAGKTTEALQEVSRLEEQIEKEGVTPPKDIQAQLLMFKALCYLRLGEQENCLLNHNEDSCLFPIRGGGIHVNQTGSRNAIRLLSEALEIKEEDLQARWLLNIAYMTLGEYPEEVPRKWYIDASAFDSDFDIKRFPDVAPALGIAVDDLAGGVVIDDFDRDGFLDIMASASGPRSQLRLFRSNGDGTYEDLTSKGGLDGVTGGLNMVQGDFNNDGFVDILVLRTGWLRDEGLHPNSLLRNNGDFTFTDVTEQAGLLSFHPTQTAVWFDYNGDGWLDIFIGNESAPTGTKHPSELYRNNRDGTFTDTLRQHRLPIRTGVKGAIAGDYNNDGRPDLYLSIIGSNNMLLQNEGPAKDNTEWDADWRFRNVAGDAGVSRPIMSFPCWFFDYDNDGWLDLFVSSYSIDGVGDIAADYLGQRNSTKLPCMYRNNGDGTFEDVTEAVGLSTLLHTMGSNFGDLDNDGWLDFYVGTGDPDFTTLIPSRMFRNHGGSAFQDVTASGGFGQLQKGHGIAFADLDNDGDQDIYSAVGGVLSGDHYPNQLFENPGHGNHWITLELEGVTSNRVAIGSRIKITVIKKDGREQVIYKTVGSGGSFGASPLRQEIGLGSAQTIKSIEIFWPASGQTQTFAEVAMDRFYKIREDQDQAIEVNLGKFVFTKSTQEHSMHH